MPIKVPVIWTLIDSLKTTATDESIAQLYTEIINVDQANELVTVLQLIEVATPHLHQSLHDHLFSLMPQLSLLLKHPLKTVRLSYYIEKSNFISKKCLFFFWF